jgi:hypothetical protein
MRVFAQHSALGTPFYLFSERVICVLIVIPEGGSVHVVKDRELAVSADPNNWRNVPELSVWLVRIAEWGEVVPEEAGRQVVSSPSVGCENNAHLLGESDILHKHVNRKTTGAIAARAEELHERVQGDRSYPIRLGSRNIEKIIRQPVVIPERLVLHLVFDDELVDGRAPDMSRPEFRILGCETGERTRVKVPSSEVVSKNPNLLCEGQVLNKDVEVGEITEASGSRWR